MLEEVYWCFVCGTYWPVRRSWRKRRRCRPDPVHSWWEWCRRRAASPPTRTGCPEESHRTLSRNRENKTRMLKSWHFLNYNHETETHTHTMSQDIRAGGSLKMNCRLKRRAATPFLKTPRRKVNVFHNCYKITIFLISPYTKWDILIQIGIKPMDYNIVWRKLGV